MSPSRGEGVGFVGDWSTRIVTLALPRPDVERMLAHEPRLGRDLELLPQALTPEGSHPVLFSFGTLHGSRMSWSSGGATLTYEEMVVVVPFVASRRRSARTGTPLPRVYLPRLFLNATVPTVGGWLYWGFNKARARIGAAQEHPGRYEVRALVAGTPLISLRWRDTPEAPFQPVSALPHFEAMRRLHDQALLGTVGPLLTYAPWTKDWSRGEVRGLSAELRLGAPFVPGLQPGHHGCEPLSADNLLGAYELRVPFTLSLPRLER